MEIGDNPYGQANTKAKCVVISCARSKTEEVKIMMRTHFPLDVPYQDLTGRLVGWIPLNRNITQDTRKLYHAHQNHFQKDFRHRIFHNLDPEAMLEVANTMNQLSVRDTLSRLKAVNTNNRLFTGMERTRGGGTLIFFDKELTPHVEETIRNIRLHTQD